MAKIKTFARIKPSESLYDDFECTRNRLYMRIPDGCGRETTIYNRTRAPIVNHEFKYSAVFNTQTSQEEVFNASAKSIIDGFLEGYNGTIFAYGQTSSGKTYTMEGDLTDYSKRGLAPRGISQIFNAVNTRKDAGESIQITVSFLEIYQETGYDLLKTIPSNGPGPSAFAKVSVVDGPQNSAIVKNLSMHAVQTEEAAQGILAQGMLNRKVAETAMNHRSSRSHAVFTIYLSSRKGDLVVRSKMHFVDLAGSERVCKTGVKGLQLSEAKYINLSLHYLEGVIIALNQHNQTTGRIHAQTAPSGVSKSWSASYKRPYSAADVSGKPRHIPYRNSLLTMLLKDSLGGNCLTSMIATVSLEQSNLSESISTCRFAQRVSCISNTARKNEEIDDKSMIKRLRTRVAELEAENNALKLGGTGSIEELEDLERRQLTKEDKNLCQAVVQDFLNGKLLDPVLAGVTDPFKFRECMSIFKKLIKDYNDQSLRLAEKLRQQPSHVQEAFYTGGRYHEAPLAKPSRRQEVSFRDDANTLARQAYSGYRRSAASNQNKQKSTIFKPTILTSSNTAGRRQEAWQQNGSAPPPATRPRTQPDLQQRDQRYKSSNSASGARAVVQTPYTKKRVSEVSQLNKQVESSILQTMNESQHLKAFKNTVIIQECKVLEDSLKRKCEMSAYQLAEQKTYVKKIKKTSDDLYLIEQEELVEKALTKRLDKLEAELHNVREKLFDMQREDIAESSELPTRSLKDKFGTMVKRDGQLDTSKVKTTLEAQQKLQNKIQKKVEQQRLLVIDKQLEIKELSTRQKLEEFKRKLAEARNGQRPATTDESLRTVDETTEVTNHKSAFERYDSGRNRAERESSARMVRPDRRVQTVQEVPSQKGRPGSQIYQPIPDTTFQKRIEEEKTPRQVSVDEIINKYRPKHKSQDDEMTAKEKAAKVDEILAKYRNQKAGNESIVEKESQRSAIIQENNVPNSRMVYRAAKIPSASDNRTQHSSGYRHDQDARQSQTSSATPIKSSATSTSTSKQVQSSGRGRSFEDTLRAMMEEAPPRRTKTWNEPNSAWKPQEQDLLKIKLQQFLSKQAKKKQSQTRRSGNSENENRYKVRSAAVDRKAAVAKTDKRPLTVADGQSRHRVRDGKTPKVSSHRMSSYYNKPATETKSRSYSNSQTRRNVQTETNGERQRWSPPAELSQIQEPMEPVAKTEIPKPAEIHFKPALLSSQNHLQKITKRNEHANKVRKAQQAATSIQRAWRQYTRRRRSSRP